MKELYRVFHYSSGFNLRLEGIVGLDSNPTGETFVVLTTGEMVFVNPGWIATTFKLAPPPAPAVTVQQDTDGDQAR